jgi:cytidylate kinase
VPVIAIDGTFASGKGTLAKALAAHYGYHYLDTGKLYRAAARDVLLAGEDPNDAGVATRFAKAIDPSSLDDPGLKQSQVAAAASQLAVHKTVRAALLDFQRSFAAKSPGAVLDGRDIGTVICPDAAVKLYIDAKPAERARRRHAELVGYGEDISLETVAAQLAERDARDAGRTEAPLKAAADAHLIDTTDLSVDAVFEMAVRIVDGVLVTG